ncbi:MAG: DUF4147 domain-containing protein [Myxococcales bacterium]|nr:DUF4147 domain-containing protein [Myxococcales bacterium]
MSASRTLLRRLFDAALAEVQGQRSTELALAALGPGPGPFFLVGAGKAASAMALGAQRVLGSALRGGLVVTKDGHALFPEQVSVREASHPLPDQRSVTAARETLAAVEGLAGGVTLLVLLSGGASALWVAPAPGIDLEHKVDVTRSLLTAGVGIEALNTVRKHLSSIKGGGLARSAAGRRVVTLLISDVAGDRLDTIASGPTAPDPTSFGESLEILLGARPRPEWPGPVLDRLEAGVRGEIAETPGSDAAWFRNVEHYVIANLDQALRAVTATARELGLASQLLPRALDGQARVRGRELAARIRSSASPELLIAGGESVVRVTGSGRGGRAQETALAFALEVDGDPGVTGLFAGTDGTDGPTTATGAIVDGSTARRAREAGLDPEAALRDNDSHTLLASTRDLLCTGPTQTNVSDLALLLRTR